MAILQVFIQMLAVADEFLAEKARPKMEEGKNSNYKADKNRGQQATAREVREGVLHVPTRMVLHTSTDTFDIEVNHVFQLFGERHCCGFRKDDLQVQPKPSH